MRARTTVPAMRVSGARPGRHPCSGHRVMPTCTSSTGCITVSTWSPIRGGEASAVLVRALEPLVGTSPDPQPRVAAGPGLVGRWLPVDRTCSGHDLTLGTGLWLTAGSPVADREVLTGPRVGVAYAGPDWAPLPWRLGVRGSVALSRPFAAGG